MMICGIKASHDGGVALIDGDRLVFSIEVEKLGNGARFSPLGDLNRVEAILRSQGVDPDEVDQFVVDGWWAELGADTAGVSLTRDGAPFRLPVAPYVETGVSRDPLRRYEFRDVEFGKRTPGYVSYHHASNHLLGSYCTSPFAARGEGALVLVWDGGMIPRLYRVDADLTVRPVAFLFPILGSAFSDLACYFGPFSPPESAGQDQNLSVAGKAMAYAALGTVATDAYVQFDQLVRRRGAATVESCLALGRHVRDHRDELFPGLTDADIIATFQGYLGHRLTTALAGIVRRRFPGQRPNLCIAGGCALNIKWNSQLRSTGLFADIWIPPFPNDSGAAIGTAACEMLHRTGVGALRWHVFSGPAVDPAGAEPVGWVSRACDERGVAEILHVEGEPVVVLSGHAELGPRALGNRSFLAPAVEPRMKDHLNAVKDRASYRPVAPICLESHSAEVFDPGGTDPYMLFEHRLRPGWAERVPAIVHLDGTARLQTITADSPGAGRILDEYHRLSGIPLLCNTSANLNGRGFFPDVVSAARHGRTRYIWSDGRLYTNPTP
ncbi:MAG: carbamoyltransferase N-terminal domain-containing protein [Actinocatenispora sp.]